MIRQCRKKRKNNFQTMWNRTLRFQLIYILYIYIYLIELVSRFEKEKLKAASNEITDTKI